MSTEENYQVQDERNVLNEIKNHAMEKKILVNHKMQQL
jgi:hypothetical protein